MDEIKAWQHAHAPARIQLTTPRQCQQWFDNTVSIGNEDASALYESLALPPHNEPWIQQRFERAIAATLMALAPVWLAQNAPAKASITFIVESALVSLSDTAQDMSKARFPTSHTGMDFVALALTRRWALDSVDGVDHYIIQLLTSNDRSAIQAVIAEAYRHREALGERWWRLLYVGMLWSGLSMLAPCYGDADVVEPAWRRWHGSLHRMSLSAACTAAGIENRPHRRGLRAAVVPPQAAILP
ncbi:MULTISPECIES: hypothetical protein [Xanthomonas]|uniref:hypothetical protein n=1 Tax=Xanthomonas TaxID=338 RepID=UPI001ADAC556|nr:MULTISPECIES: hypothetical protein [unclassified Xanthomonas]MBO9873808.1 hypothetical protein [Xanthomonas sp. D-93]WNH43973.1 hypothetical protein PG878_15820 [Xanthomonas sp. A6251]